MIGSEFVRALDTVSAVKILVVDDSSVMRKLVARSVRQAGYDDAEILEAADGASAIEVVRTARPDLVLADWNMPVMTGLEMLQTLRSERENVVVGFVTSESTVEIRQSANEAGASFFLTKPIDADDLRDAFMDAGI